MYDTSLIGDASTCEIYILKFIKSQILGRFIWSVN